MTRRLPLRTAIVAAVVAALATSCGGGSAPRVSATPGPKIIVLPPTTLPSRFAGLAVSPEDIHPTLAVTGLAYVDQAGLFGLRDNGSVLEATLEISRFAHGAPYSSPSFQAGVVNRIGSTSPLPYRLGADTVFLTNGPRQNIAVWFRDRYLMVLSVRQDYPAARALLRSALEVKP